ncbi:hypothetical protein ACGC1H_002270 [Rhizoctonia solani]
MIQFPVRVLNLKPTFLAYTDTSRIINRQFVEALRNDFRSPKSTNEPRDTAHRGMTFQQRGHHESCPPGSELIGDRVEQNTSLDETNTSMYCSYTVSAGGHQIER